MDGGAVLLGGVVGEGPMVKGCCVVADGPQGKGVRMVSVCPAGNVGGVGGVVLCASCCIGICCGGMRGGVVAPWLFWKAAKGLVLTMLLARQNCSH